MEKHINRNYKDTVFRILFSEKSDLLTLYNAINNTCYRNAEDLEITTLEGAIYIGVKNDISFIISNWLNLYEHQSTLCKNMPLRGLFYFADLYKKYIIEPELLYRVSLLKIPTPRYIVFYNGNSDIEDVSEMKLSDAFIEKSDELVLELKAKIININYGHNKELLNSCKRLRDYSLLVSYIKENLLMMDLKDAIETAVDRCIKEDVLKEFLVKHRAEVSTMFLAQYNEERMKELWKEESYEEGEEAGILKGKIDTIIEILSEIGEVSDTLRSKLQKETDSSLLIQMTKYAASAKSIEAFIDKFNL